jgi:hypothetical protein
MDVAENPGATGTATTRPAEPEAVEPKSGGFLNRLFGN